MKKMVMVGLLFSLVLGGFAQEAVEAPVEAPVDSVAMQVADLLDQAEAAHDAKDYDATMELLVKAEALQPNNVDVLWRISRAYFDFADRKPNDLEYQKEFVYPGLEYAKIALKLDDNSAGAHKWYAIHIGRIGEIEGTKQKIINSYEMKDHTLKAIELDPEDDGNYHVMGRWHYALSDLSWIERQIASLIYATPPEASYEEALEFFKKANAIDPEDIRNMLYIGHCYEELDDEDSAAIWYKKAINAEASSDSDKQLKAEAEEALADL